MAYTIYVWQGYPQPRVLGYKIVYVTSCVKYTNGEIFNDREGF